MRQGQGNSRYRLHLAGYISPTFGDFSRTMWDGSAEYFITKDISAISELSILQNSTPSGSIIPGTTDVIWTLLLKYNM